MWVRRVPSTALRRAGLLPSSPVVTCHGRVYFREHVLSVSAPRPTGVHHEQHHRHLVHTVPLGLVTRSHPRRLRRPPHIRSRPLDARLGRLPRGGRADSPVHARRVERTRDVVQLGLGYLFVTRRLGGVRAAASSRADLSLVAAGSVAVLAVTFGGSALLAAVGLEAPPDAMLALATSEPLGSSSSPSSR